MKRWSVTIAPLVVAAMIGGYWTGQESRGQQVVAPPAQVKEVTSYRDIVKRVLPAVVSIETKYKAVRPTAVRPKDRTQPRLPDGVPDEFRKFFEGFGQSPDMVPETPRQGFGSGFFIDANGVVLTNYHVVDGADHVIVTTTDGRKFISKDIKGDRRTDLAIVRLDAKNVPYLEMGDSEQMEIGDRVLAFGAPFGLTGSVTQGIVSAKGRNSLNMNMYEDFIQTDAAINPGNSGGPLINLEGKVIGINSAIKSRSGGFQGVGLAVASNLAKSVVNSLKTDGVVRRGYLGVQVRELDPEVGERLGVSKDAGVMVAEVFENTPAGKAGIQPGDVITHIAGKAVKDGRVLQTIVAGLPLNQPSEVITLRDGKTRKVPVTVEEMPNQYGYERVPAARTPSRQSESVTVEKLGVDLADLDDQLAEDLGLRKGMQGAVITRVAPGSLASEAGLRRGMLIQKVDSQRVMNASAAREALENASLSRGVLLQVQSAQGGTNVILLRQENA